MTADLLRAPSPPRFCDGRISAVSLLLGLRDVNYIAGLSVEVTALQCGPEGFSTKRSNNGRFRATMWPPSACDLVGGPAPRRAWPHAGIAKRTNSGYNCLYAIANGGGRHGSGSGRQEDPLRRWDYPQGARSVS